MSRNGTAMESNGRPQAGRGPKLFALLEFRDEARFLPGWIASVTPEVDGILALDDGSSDGAGELLAGHPALLELERRAPHGDSARDGAANRRALHELAGRHDAEWLVAIDADERPESGFGERARAEIARLENESLRAASVRIRELWDRPDHFRADGRWGEKRHARLFRFRPDAEIDPRPLHGHAAPLDARVAGGFPPADLWLYHLRMIRAEDRLARRLRHERLDPDRRHQAVGYAHLTDEAGIELAPVPPDRDYRRPDRGEMP